MSNNYVYFLRSVNFLMNRKNRYLLGFIKYVVFIYIWYCLFRINMMVIVYEEKCIKCVILLFGNLLNKI